MEKLNLKIEELEERIAPNYGGVVSAEAQFLNSIGSNYGQGCAILPFGPFGGTGGVTGAITSFLARTL